MVLVSYATRRLSCAFFFTRRVTTCLHVVLSLPRAFTRRQLGFDTERGGHRDSAPQDEDCCWNSPVRLSPRTRELQLARVEYV